MKNLAPTDAAALEAVETREWLESLDYVLAAGRQGPRRAAARCAARARAPVRRQGAVHVRRRPTSTRFRRHEQVPYPGRPRDRAPHQEPRPLERARDGRAREPRVGRHRRPHLDVSRRRRRSTRSASIISSAARTPAATRTSSTTRATPRRASTRARFSKAASTKTHLHNFRHELRDGRRAVVVPAPVADAGLLGVPDGLDGPRPAHGDLPGAVHRSTSRTAASSRRPIRRSGRSSATAKRTSPKRSARSRSPRARSSTT